MVTNLDADNTVTHLPFTALNDLHIMNRPEFSKWTSTEVVKTSRSDYCNHVMTEVSGPVATDLCWPGRAEVPEPVVTDVPAASRPALVQRF